MPDRNLLNDVLTRAVVFYSKIHLCHRLVLLFSFQFYFRSSKTDFYSPRWILEREFAAHVRLFQIWLKKAIFALLG